MCTNHYKFRRSLCLNSWPDNSSRFIYFLNLDAMFLIHLIVFSRLPYIKIFPLLKSCNTFDKQFSNSNNSNEYIYHIKAACTEMNTIYVLHGHSVITYMNSRNIETIQICQLQLGVRSLFIFWFSNKVLIIF